ncbi:hypothetical protein O181_044796 [Austropuccinia psidii MF-1]|uniref:Uncharacterized protein n=1 Tax=Austropuccinia psidii MF-1 TaxID=1389203 RepID=A0A9Q3DJ06_9BASI|nr:hypothetical protein [Austropuccinia psidii MF-1]
MKNSSHQLKELDRKINKQKTSVKVEDHEEKKELMEYIKQINRFSEAVIAKNEKIKDSNQISQIFKPRENVSPPPNRSVPYVPEQDVTRFNIKCYYCMEEGHPVGRCTEIVDDQNKKWVIRQGFNYLYPNWERVPNDGKFPPKYLVRELWREEEELKRKLEEKNKEEEQKKEKK